MKLRIRGDSVRLRLTRSEVARASRGETIREVARFGPDPSQRLEYLLETSAGLRQIRAQFEANQIRVMLPAEQARNWGNTEQVGLETEQSIGEGASLRILIEKDFACLTPRESEDDSDAFANPNACC